MNILLVVGVGTVILIAAYFTYGKFLATKVFNLDDANKTPAVEMEDGVDFDPTDAKFLSGQHFSAIAAAGPVTGPVIAGLIFGWVPTFLWIIFGTIFIGVPLAIWLGLERETIGATHSIAREANVALIGDKYGLDGAEGRGVMGVYIVGTVFGTIFFALMASFIDVLKIFHPYSLAMACGVGSASMATASAGVLASIYPAMKDQILALAAASNMLSGLDGLYMSIWMGLPLTEWLYKKLSPIKHGTPAPARGEEK